MMLPRYDILEYQSYVRYWVREWDGSELLTFHFDKLKSIDSCRKLSEAQYRVLALRQQGFS